MLFICLFQRDLYFLIITVTSSKKSLCRSARTDETVKPHALDVIGRQNTTDVKLSAVGR